MYMYILAKCEQFLFPTPIFEKSTKAIVHGFVKKRGFEVGNGIKPC